MSAFRQAAIPAFDPGRSRGPSILKIDNPRGNPMIQSFRSTGASRQGIAAAGHRHFSINFALAPGGRHKQTAQKGLLKVSSPKARLGIPRFLITTTAYQINAANHGYMVYDTLFGDGTRSSQVPRVNAADGRQGGTSSRDNLTYTFHAARTGQFHDGAPVRRRLAIA